MSFPSGRHPYIRTRNICNLHDGSSDGLVAAAKTVPTPRSTAIIQQLHGAGEEAEKCAQEAFGPTYDRLLESKSIYGLTNLFLPHANIKPTVMSICSDNRAKGPGFVPALSHQTNHAIAHPDEWEQLSPCGIPGQAFGED